MEEEALTSDDSAFAPMVALEMDAAVFNSDWKLCDVITEYLSDIVGQGHSDPARYSNFVSVAANELIELAFRSALIPGSCNFSVFRNSKCNRMIIAFPCDDALREAYAGSKSWSSNEPRRLVDGGFNSLTSPIDLTDLVTNLATIFGAHIQIEGDGASGIRFVADFSPAEGFH
ncbi:hypothetical protein AB4Z52_21470 [Rhizobium sp. 2YAF20]|uniref:hypothetical protein n=1 Tax=Rhizobium sp. 2YAF20 TaxID=3233027 RepID=UPI003F9D1628